MPSRPPSTYVVSITPFSADGELDEDGLRRHLRRIGGAGVGVYLAGSGSGEGYTLDPAETARVLELGVAELRGRVPVRAMGVDALQLYSLDPGHGNQPSSAELDRYYRTVLDATSLPVVLSTHESVGYLLPVDLVASLVRDTERVVGVNCSTGDMTYLVRLIEAVDGRADVHVGGPMHALTGLAVGGQGFLSSDANLAPRLCADVIEAWTAGDVRTLAASFRRLLRLYTATRELGGVTATKAALELLGLPGGPPRPPRLPASGETLAGVQRRILAELRPSDVDG
jgi:4-hydroxy-tetrahydrodipicolinate synthase